MVDTEARASRAHRLVLRGLAAFLVVALILILSAPAYDRWGLAGIVAIVSSTLIVLYAPLAVAQLVLLWRNGRFVRAAAASTLQRPVVAGRRVLVIITTNGQNPSVVEKIARTLGTYTHPGPFEVRTLVEEADPYPYSTPCIRVPAGYETPRGSRLKMRALHYGSEWLRLNAYGPETYVVHLDDDSIPSQGYIDWVYRMEEVAGQGNVRLREHGHHLLSTLADLVRVSDCDAWCDYFNRRGKPMAVHGEGLVIRADVESRLGWDFATYGADDFLMGQKLVNEGCSFGCIPHEIFIAPPTTARDFYKQRRRWLISILWARKEVTALRPIALKWILYRYAVGWLGLFGIGLAVVSVALRAPIPLPLGFVGVFNLLSYIAFYQYGAWRTDARYRWRMFLLQYPVALYEGGTFVYSLLWPPDRRVFDVIRKV